MTLRVINGQRPYVDGEPRYVDTHREPETPRFDPVPGLAVAILIAVLAQVVLALT